MFIKEESEVAAGKGSPRIPGQRTAGPEPDSAFPGEAPMDMEPSAGNPSQGPTAMLIRIFGRKDQELYGDIVHYGLKKPVPYRGAAELVLRIDAISRSLGHPSAESPGTSGNRFHSVRRIRGGTGNVLPEKYWQEEDRRPGCGIPSIFSSLESSTPAYRGESAGKSLRKSISHFAALWN